MLTALARSLSPSKEFARYVGFACALAFLLTVVAPAASVVKKLPEAIKLRAEVIKTDAEEYALLGTRKADALAKESLARSLDALIADKTGTDAFSSSYDFSFTERGVLCGITATLFPDGAAAYAVLGIKKESLEKTLSGLVASEVTIVLS